MTRIIRDESTTSAYWAALNTLACMPDVHVIADAPIGCYNLAGVAVIDYTDAIPYLRNFTPTDLTEKAISSSGTTAITKDTIEKLLGTGKTLIVMSTAESEMVGADHTQMLAAHYPQIKFFSSNSLLEDEWEGRDRVLKWCFDTYATPDKPNIINKTVSIIGPTYGCFNSPSDLHEVKRLIAGAGGICHVVFPMEATLRDIEKLKESDVVIVMYREFGEALAKALGRPYLFAPFGLRETEQFVRDLGEYLQTKETAEHFIRKEKETTLKLIWDLWRGPQSEWFPTVTFGVCAAETYARGIRLYLEGELGMTCHFSQITAKADNSAIRETLHRSPPQLLFGRMPDKIYLAEANAKTHFIPAGFPIPIVRRALGTPFMGFSGAVFLVQEIVNQLYDTLFQFLPIQRLTNATTATQSRQDITWEPEARKALEERIKRAPFISQISFSRELQQKAEEYARKKGITLISAALLNEL